MLIHQIQVSEGASTPSVVLNSRTVSTVIVDRSCSSGIKLDSTGVLFTIQSNGGFSAISGEWLNNGTASNFYVRHNITSGTLETDPTENVWNQLSSDRTYINLSNIQNISKTTQVFFEVSSDANGTTIVASANMTFTSERVSLD